MAEFLKNARTVPPATGAAASPAPGDYVVGIDRTGDMERVLLLRVEALPMALYLVRATFANAADAEPRLIREAIAMAHATGGRAFRQLPDGVYVPLGDTPGSTRHAAAAD